MNSPHDFREVFIDEGEVNMIDIMRSAMTTQSHSATDRDGSKGVAFAVGYMRAQIQEAYSEDVTRAPDDQHHIRRWLAGAWVYRRGQDRGDEGARLGSGVGAHRGSTFR